MAVVDVNVVPRAPTDDIPEGTPTQSPKIEVQCFILAHLRSGDEKSLKVEELKNEKRLFNGTGRVTWTWQVTALKPGQHDLVLELQPAAYVGDNAYVGDPSNSTLPNVTSVEVTAGPVETVSFWWADTWPLIVSVIGGVGVALLGLIAWGGSLGEAVKKARATWRRSADDPGRATAGASGAPPEPERPDDRRSGYL